MKKSFRPSFLNECFFSREVIYFRCKKANERTVLGRDLEVHIFFAHICFPEYSLVNIKVVSALVLEEIIFFKHSYLY